MKKIINIILSVMLASGACFCVRAETGISRQTAITEIVKVLGGVSGNYSVLDVFSDKDEILDQNTPYITYAVEYGWIGGNAGGRLFPNDGVTRAAAAVFLCNVLELQPAEGSAFSDLSGHWAAGYAYAMCQENLMGGFGDAFLPDNPLTDVQLQSLCGSLTSYIQSKPPLIRFSIEALPIELSPGGEFKTSILIADRNRKGVKTPAVSNLACVEGRIAFDSSRLEVRGVTKGNAIPSGWILQQNSPDADSVYVSLSRPNDTFPGLDSTGKLLDVVFRAVPDSGGCAIFAFQDVQFLDTSGNNTEVTSDGLPVLGISSSVNIIPSTTRITEANIPRQTIAISLDNDAKDIWENTGAENIRCDVSIRKNESYAWTLLDENIFDGCISLGWIQHRKLILPISSGFEFNAGDRLEIRLSARVFNKNTGSFENVGEPVVTPVFVVPDVLGKPLDLNGGFGDFRIEGCNLSYHGSELEFYGSALPPTVRFWLNGKGPFRATAAVAAPNGEIVDMSSFDMDVNDFEIPINPEWVNGSYRLLIRADCMSDQTCTTVAFASIPFNIRQTAAINGRILNPDGSHYQPTDNNWADIILKRAEDGSDAAWTGCFGDGYFAFLDDLPDGRYIVCAMPRGQYGGSAPAEVEIIDGASVALDLTLTEAVITGRVLNPDGFVFEMGQDCRPDAGVRLYRLAEGTEEFVCRANVARDGSYSLGGLTSGSYRLYAESWNNNIYTPAIPLDFEYTEGEPLSVDIYLTAPLISGRVLKPDGSVFVPGQGSHVYVKLRNADNNGEDVCGAEISDSGTFILGGDIPEGNYLLIADSNGENNPYANSVPAPVTVTPGQTAQIDLRLTNPVIQGRVLKPDGSPFIPGFESYVYVKLRNPDNSGEDICGDSVNDDGTYKLGGNVPEGDYLLAADANGRDNPCAGSFPVEVHIGGQTTYRDIMLNTLIRFDIERGQLLFVAETGSISGFAGSPTNIVIPNSIKGFTVEAISDNAFDSCTSLESITIPGGVTYIDRNAFANCTALMSAYFYGDAPDTDGRLFDDAPDGFNVYYLSGKTGFAPNWQGLLPVAFEPPADGILTNSAGLYLDGKRLEAVPPPGSRLRIKAIYSNVAPGGNSAYFVVAVKCGGRLIDIKVISCEFDINQTKMLECDFTLPILGTPDVEVKAMLWKDLSIIRPISVECFIL